MIMKHVFLMLHEISHEYLLSSELAHLCILTHFHYNFTPCQGTWRRHSSLCDKLLCVSQMLISLLSCMLKLLCILLPRYDNEYKPGTDGQLQSSDSHNAGLRLHETAEHEDGPLLQL